MPVTPASRDDVEAADVLVGDELAYVLTDRLQLYELANAENIPACAKPGCAPFL